MIIQVLLGAIPVVETPILAQDMVEVLTVEAEEVIQTLALERADPGLSAGVGVAA